MQSPPNVLFVIADDLAWGDLACHGNPYVHTPHLDRLHAEGVRLTGYRSGPVCTPARACLMTGRHAYRTRAIDTYMGRSMMDPAERTLPEILRDAGYATAISGKWHLGDRHPMRAIDKGFDAALVHDGGGLTQPANPTTNNGYFGPDLWHDGTLETVPGYCTDVFAGHARRAIVDHVRARPETPFFGYFAANAPHAPLHVPDAWAKRFHAMDLPEKWARLYGMIENLDANVGALLETLDELAIADRTLVVFTSDHGPCASAAVAGEDRFNGGLRGRKGTVFDGGLRVPCFWRWPGTLPAGRDVPAPTGPVDVLPTLAAICGARAPADRTIDGADLSPALRGEANDAPRDRALFYQWHRGDVPVRRRNACVVMDRYKLVTDETLAHGLYDLVADPREERDRAAEMPQRVRDLAARYEAWFDDVSTTRGLATFDPPRIALGTRREPVTVLTRQDWRPRGADDWSDAGEGIWRVRVAEPGRYRVTLRVPPTGAAAELRLEIGHAARAARPEPGTETYTFHDLRLSAGETSVAAWVADADGRRGARYVDVERA